MTQSLVAFSLVGAALSQQAGDVKKEFHPPMSLGVCTKSGGCSEEKNTVVLDANWRWIHNTGGYDNCYDGGWNATFCPDSDSCCKNCAIDGVEQEDWSATYGVNHTEGGYKLGLQQGGNVGSRFYMLDGTTPTNYRIFKLKNREFTFDVDMSTLNCGINGALYFVEMDPDGGVAKARDGLNKAGATYGTGYCDAQCANDIKFIGGVANIDEDSPYGSCCAEMDIWEANKEANAYTTHPCSFEGALRCEGDDCGKVCDQAGCDFNPYRNGVKDFYGAGSDFTVDTSKPFTVVTQFITDDGTDDGDISEIRRFYMQDGKTIDNAKTSVSGLDTFDSISEATCEAQKKVFGEDDTHKSHGGLKAMSDAIGRGMVLVMSIWDDGAANMLWLDSVYPPEATGPGAERGPCSTDSGKPDDVEKENPDAYAAFANVKVGEIGSTTGNTPSPTPSPTPVPPPTPSPVPSTGCCSWAKPDQIQACGDSTDYCMANADNCVQCDGHWIHPDTPSPTPPPSPTPSDCPGGSLNACLDACPAAIFTQCAESCQRRCPQIVV